MLSPETMGPYGFALNSPHVWRDPSGEFTLVELSVVTAIVGVLATLAIPTVSWAYKRARGFQIGWSVSVANDLDNWGVDDFGAGFGDSFSLGLTGIVRSLLSADSVDENSPAYFSGVVTEMIFEALLTGGGAAMRHAAARAFRPGVYAAARRGVTNSGLRRGGRQVHHINPLFGHPGGSSTYLPLGGLPAWLHSGRWNLVSVTHTTHLAFHRRLRYFEGIVKRMYHPGLLGARAARNCIELCEQE